MLDNNVNLTQLVRKSVIMEFFLLTFSFCAPRRTYIYATFADLYFVDTGKQYTYKNLECYIYEQYDKKSVVNLIRKKRASRSSPTKKKAMRPLIVLLQQNTPLQ